MKKKDIETLVSRRIREAIEEAIGDAIGELNRTGHDFHPVDEFTTEFREPGSDMLLSITCPIGVGYTKHRASTWHGDGSTGEAVEWFIELAESGEDEEATMLNLLEGDIANGGFYQLYDNKGAAFIREAAVLLGRIGARARARMLQQCIDLMEKSKDALKGYDRLRRELDRLDARFDVSKEDIAGLFARYRKVSLKD